MDVTCTDLPLHTSDLLFDGKNEGHWKLYKSESGYVFETFHTLTGEKNKVCFLSLHFDRAKVFVIPTRSSRYSPKALFGSKPAWYFSQLMQPLAQIMLMNLMAGEEGIMVHALGVNDNGEGRLFLGSSGKGKSTMASFWKEKEGVCVLSDEHIILRRELGRYWMYGTPWPGMANLISPDRVPLTDVYFIEHASKNVFLKSATVAEIFPLLFLPLWDGDRMIHIFNQCEQLSQAFTWNKLGFVKNESVVDFVRQS